MEDIFFMRVFDGLEKTVHIVFNFHVVKAFIINEALVEILFHEFEH